MRLPYHGAVQDGGCHCNSVGITRTTHAHSRTHTPGGGDIGSLPAGIRAYATHALRLRTRSHYYATARLLPLPHYHLTTSMAWEDDALHCMLIASSVLLLM